ncbi:hypothetical protein H9660_04590 [Clostridium sp. Sa3CUN1]|uniref:DUF5643 domain-containing protein n=1 Tax=Clostridium gallinarum TaxID=2762246 RepID=A0ABR8Q1W6_9CLOT|nr:hypothetical protein [Clostridium gallinarum]MBD7914416.1 hypothetical protein [Clostridium gallinarum]
MRNIKTALRILGVMLLVSFILSIASINYLKLSKPVFLKSYVETDIAEGEDRYKLLNFDIELKYISNIEDKRKVVGILFDEAPEINFKASETEFEFARFYNYSNDNIESHGRYGIHTVFLNVDISEQKIEIDDKLILSEATVVFDDGVNIKVDLGKIVLNRNNISETPLENSGVEGSNYGYSKSIFWTKDYIQVDNIYSVLFEDTRDLFDFNINKTGDIKDRSLIYNKNENLYFVAEFHSIEDSIRKMYMYDIQPKIYFKDRNGKEYEKRVYNITYYPTFKFFDIYKYLRELGEL